MSPVTTMFLLSGALGLAAPADETLTGCFEKPATASLYADGERLTIRGDLDFAKHVGHIVK